MQELASLAGTGVKVLGGRLYLGYVGYRIFNGARQALQIDVRQRAVQRSQSSLPRSLPSGLARTRSAAKRGIVSSTSFAGRRCAAMQILVNIDVGDLQSATCFYCDAFSLTVGRRFGEDGVELLGASSAIYLLAKAEGSAASEFTSQTRSYDRHWSPIHLDFVVPEIEPAVARAVSAGATLEKPVQTSKWGRLALLADPFGHGLCLVEFIGRGYDEIAQA